MDGMTAPQGNMEIPVTWRRSARARRFSLRVSSLDGTVTLSLPLRARKSEAEAFLVTQGDWLRAALSRVPPAQVVMAGVVLPFEGRPRQIVAVRGRGGVKVFDDRIEVAGDADRLAAKLGAFMKARARDRLANASDLYAARLGRRVAGIALRDTRSRWGSCSVEGRLMYSWRLIMAPPAVLDYVAAHEASHLVEMNHSDAFWTLVAQICPDWKTHRNWLRSEGNALHAWRFRA
jgi:predicted metal-dependent hydrolase